MSEGTHIRVLVPLLCAIYSVSAQLTPPSFNLAKDRDITATSTCGVGVSSPELYCLLTGTEGGDDEKDSIQIQGQLCDYCDPSNPQKNHSVYNAIDGSEQFWQSPPLSRGDEYNAINIEIPLGQEFFIAYIYIKMAKSPRPGVWVLEKSVDFGETYEPWQYFGANQYDCMNFFNTKANEPLTKDDQILCVTRFSRIVPLLDGEILVSLTNGRPNAYNFSHADDLKEFMRATNVRIRLIRTKTLLGHLMAVANQDPTVTRRYFYSIRDISIGGRCVCNGHADTCSYLDPFRPNFLVCDCQHNTVGDQCERCDEANGFVQKKWQPARANTPFICEPCQCYGRASSCVYDADVDAAGESIDIHGFYNGGGVCQNCAFNSTGNNCEKCVAGYYRPFGVPPSELYMCERCRCDPQFHIDECEEETGRCLCKEGYTGYACDQCDVGYYNYPDCIPCDCDVYGTEGDVCHVGGGQCPCKPSYVGKKCDMCENGYYNFPDCALCECDSVGSVDQYCNVDTGQCKCQMNYDTRNCSDCAHGYFNFPDCALCSCDPQGTVEEVCDKTNGDCLCKETFSGDRCDSCARGYYAYPDCMACQCQEPGSTTNLCEDRSGQCSCQMNYAGQNCERCATGYYKYPDCIPCECDDYGSLGESCDQETGQCDCRYNFQGLMCDKCKEGLYNYPNCEECNCNPAGAKEVPGYPLGGCGEVAIGLLCECKAKVTGRICDTCFAGYWNLNRNTPDGCEPCSCSDAGTITSMNMCNMITGQCMCKVDVTGQNCDTCQDGYYGLHKQNLFGCHECDCDIGGSESLVCEKETGQCPCKPRVEGRRCDQAIQSHFIPTLDQMRLEIEDGYTPEGHPIRYGFDERLFPNFSWKGYAILTPLQNEVRVDLDIYKPSIYRVIYRYVNLNDHTVTGNVTWMLEGGYEGEQKGMVKFGSSSDPAFSTVSDQVGNFGYVLNPGRWTMAVKTDENVFLDYMILIPQDYFEATVLQTQVFRPCLTPDDAGPCLHYTYPEVLDYPSVIGSDGFVLDVNDSRVPVDLFDNNVVLRELNISDMAILDPEQQSFYLNLYIPKTDKYVLVLNYHSNANVTQNLLFEIGDEAQATAVIYNCQYSSLCRQVLLGLDEMEGVFELDEGFHTIKVMGEEDVSAGIESIVAIPYHIWTIHYIRPSIICIRINGVCVGSRYSTPIGSMKIEFEALPNDHLISEWKPPGLTDTDIGLVLLNRTQNLIVLLGQARNPGVHKFLVHYYLPYDTGSEMSVLLYANGQVYKGTFRPRFCPGINGCRDLIYFEDSGQSGDINLLNVDVKVEFNNTSGQDIWMDYLLLIPSGQYSSNNLVLQPVDNSRNFIDVCLDDGYKVKTPISDFCENSLFTLTTEFNNGALECECDIDGSLDFSCDPYGGQCNCRPNVIGRTCSACRVGYYGFPRCQPCNCPFGLCHQLTGQCICPPRVTGDRCDVCEPGTYGYDALIGCQECSCNPQGVVDGDINCDENTGECSCLPGIGGRKCDYCVAGFYAFPQCRECDCNRAGTTEDICSAQTSDCSCKEHVMGDRCDECMPYTFNLDDINPYGCTRCFCFGNTAKCGQSTLYWDTISEMKGWNLTNMVDGEVREAGEVIALLDALDTTANTSMSMYWVAPDAYLGNKVKSYGGFLRYKLLFVLSRNDSIETEATYDPDLILVGNNGQTIVYRAPVQPYNSIFTDMEVQLLEYNFVHADSGYPGRFVDRETFMMILVNLEALHIKGSYYSVVEELRMMNIELDFASDSGVGEQASTVEQCVCPRGYTGTSCEDCAHGFYRARTYPYLGICLPCECNGLSDSCDLYTGECYNCQNNTVGAHCESCQAGYLSSSYFTQDSYQRGCTICGCPLGVDSNNFADTCSLRRYITGDTHMVCDCHDGYAGDRCERCSPGYYGDPMVEGTTCDACQCSGNIDMRDPDSCDYQTGACLKCTNNSTGVRCERCMDWFYGDAVEAKDCYPCSCNTCGSVACNNKQGRCTCKPNVIGINCDTCAPDTWGFNECQGCRSCDCAEASLDTQCDPDNGTCSCQPGVTGYKCESCVNGFWNYQDTGCERCQCDYDGAVTCDPLDGTCQCLPGVTGEMCETCLDRWVLIPQEGCRECDECTHYLLDDVEYMDGNITQVQAGLSTVSIGVYAMQRLDAANESVAMYEPMLTSILYESENITLDPVEKELDQWSTITNNILIRTKTSLENSNGIVEDSVTLVEKSEGAVKMGEMSEQEASDAILYIKDILGQINEGIRVTNIETYITLVEQSMENIKMSNFTAMNDSITEELIKAEMMLAVVNEQMMTPKSQKEVANTVMTDLKDVEDRLLDLQTNSQDSEGVAMRAMAIIDKLNLETMVAIESHVGGVEVGQEMTVDTIKSGDDLLDEARSANVNSTKEFSNVDQASANIEQAKAVMTEFTKIYKDMERSELDVNSSWAHADDLEEQAQLLDNVYTDTRDIASNAVAAGSAYENIELALENALAAAEKAVEAANSAKLQSGGVGDISMNMTMSSEILLMGAKMSYNTTQIELVGRLGYAKAGTDQMEEMNMNVDKASSNLDMSLKRLPVGVVGNQSEDVMGKSEMSARQAEGALGSVTGILGELPEEEEKTGPLVTNVINFSKDINLAKTQVNNVQESIPKITKLLADVKNQSDVVKGLGRQVTFNLNELREKIAIARNQANLIRVGLKFLGNTTATLRNPPNVAEAGSNSKVSLYFKTTAENGLLLYAGSARSGTGQPNQDYMAVELEGGNVVFKYDLGGGVAKINHPHYVSDGKWYKVTAQRIGKAGTLMLERDPTEQPLEPVYGKTSGLSSVLEMHRLTSKFYVGGIPSGSSISSDVTRTYYVGVMEDVEFDDKPMGLWNYEMAENNLQGARERDILTTILSNGFRFDGSGYVILSTSETAWKPAVQTRVNLKMKTYAEDGLLFFVSDEVRDFLSLEVNNGTILFQYDLGGGRAQLRSTKKVNDGEWHNIYIVRLNKTGLMNVDDEEIGPVEGPGKFSQLSITDDISIGGYQDIILPASGVTKQGFEGCIEDLTLQTTTTWDLIDNKKMKGVIRGCPDQIARVATFSASKVSYLAKAIDSIGANFDLTFKMKTKKNTSLVLFAGHSEQDVGFSVSVVNGMIAVVSATEEEKIELMSRVNTYNDGRWHYVSIMKMGLKLMMNIDDYEIVQGEGQGTQKRLETNTPLYFGRPDLTWSKGVTPTTEVFDGCIGDVTINGEFLNFATIPASIRPGTSLSGCPIPDPEGPYEREKITTQYPPFEWPSTTTTEAPVVMEKCALEAHPPYDLAPEDLKGLYYGAYPKSRIEYTSMPASVRVRSAFSMEFKTTAPNGVLFYFADKNDVDHLSLIIQDGKIRYTFNSGTGLGEIVSTDSYNDGAWHMLEVGRSLKEGTLQVDGQMVATTKSQGRARSINGKPPYYFGGVNENNLTNLGKINLDGVLESFKGCIANIKLNKKDIGEPVVRNGIIPCSDLTEVGAYFFENGGYISIIESFNVGRDLEVELEIRPRSMNGIIFSVHGKKGDFVLLQMIEGKLQFRVDNGAGAVIADYVPDMKTKLCDGNWHKIIATKNKNVVFLTVDYNEPIKTVGTGSASSADTKNPFYLGGKPDAITKGIRAKGNYQGCIRNVRVNGEMKYLTTGVVFGNVGVEMCPVD